MNEAESFLLKLLDDRYGAIVSSGDCDVLEISDAQATGRFYVDKMGYGFVLRYNIWLQSREIAFKQLGLSAKEVLQLAKNSN